MVAFDNKVINEKINQRNEIIDWCIQTTKEFYDIAKKQGTPLFTRDCKYSFSPLTAKDNVTKTIRNFSISIFPIHIVEFYILMLSNKTDSVALNEDYSAAISVKDMKFYYDGHISSPEEIGEAIAKACGYKKEVAENLFISALAGEPWDTWYASKQADMF